MSDAHKWKQGEHVVIIGDTGSGKTYLESKLLPLREYVIVLRTKPDDIKFDGFRKVDSYLKLGNVKEHKFLLTPKYEEQQLHASRAMEMVWKEGGWAFAIDELYYATSVLRVERQVNKLVTQGRSKAITMVMGMQRPAWISRFALSQATHAFIFRCEGRDMITISQSLSPSVIKPIEKLKRYEFVYFNRADRTVKIGNARKLEEIIY